MEDIRNLLEPQTESDERRARRHRDKSATEEEWWASNIQYLEKKTPDKLAEYRAIEAEVYDQLHWMKYGHRVDPADPDFVSLQEGMTDLEDFVQQHGLVHLGRIYFKDTDEVFMWDGQYWKDKKLLDAICSLSPATKVFAKFGILTAIPDWRYRHFKEDVRKTPSQDGAFELDENRWRNPIYPR